ncbi:hypothetical protein Afer_1067 [Acidimicrobium ferrooxidans DSM 10331]|uniref:PD-(D/E)XK endonuclease-like domain-containing protein n=1 Tax=Acidimicrobium ferrooxidans (strain DSM 10331 / JCM 15462 / NBRC 103882 / ICP) TaxID=525909 RepID=C7LZ44_ACIFD|nr:PD-(D/E)XK nuclease family protein [Acidimicrobium ferrooxidans]ACU54002.1 hypothetical protein Afer_1067 [Acidimicrobium ferrooxidans DSM 10331]
MSATDIVWLESEAALVEALWRPGDPVAGDVIAEVRHELAELASQLPTEQTWRLTKRIVASLVACERYGTAELRREIATPRNRAMDLGTVFEAGVRSWFAYGAEYHAGDDVALWLEAVTADGGTVELDAEQMADVVTRRARLVERLGIEEAWWPRTEVRARADLTDHVLLTGRFDLVVGGAASGRPHHLVEIKSSLALSEEHESELRFYALLAGLRYGPPPASIILLGPGEAVADARQLVMSERVVRDGARLVADALRAAARGLAGAPIERAGPRCTQCPFREDCATYAEAAAP